MLRHPITKADNPNLPIHSTGAVYVVSCQDCSSTYVGETGRTTYIRLTEHKRNIHYKEPKSLIYQHTAQTGQQFNLDQPKILYRNIHNKYNRLYLESVIPNQINSINRKIDIPDIYQVFVFTLLDCRLGKNWFLTGYGHNRTLPLRRRKKVEVKEENLKIELKKKS
ncbi:hypothetical protein LAZ67_18000988 [Cordylochernes scorpioides]|uniref:GIY-YIG domain-containing protein n=1 Tax=Cordylochernes scorpioides TaxID=51811 RepID=A0ABY6LFD7_9ARAC|nr:hypothetical protein LAZ67_18000988 [Cordylochernes scorpioides]